ncbi:MAG: M48 family metalloprotease [Candidatus Sumerlaeota bacterium]|nr:M48 family metalloprotease [Candidatus Sumerlaeota bacterium]
MELISDFAGAWGWWAMHASWQLALLVALVGALAFVARRLSPRLRYALWLLVTIKIFLPPSLALDWGVGTWGIHPMWQFAQARAMDSGWRAIPQDAGLRLSPAAMDASIPSGGEEVSDHGQSPDGDGAISSARAGGMMLFMAWLLGAAGFAGVIVARYLRFLRRLRHAEVVDEGPLRVELERLAARIGKENPPELLLSADVTSPLLCGLFTPKIVLPANLPDLLSPAELSNVLLHELVHWRRRDVLAGWLQLAGQALFWFHPFVWLANARARHERECACDEAALAMGGVAPKSYGESLLKVLLVAEGRPSASLGFLGIFERGARIQSRLEEIMRNKKLSKRGGWGWIIVALFALAFIPMSSVTVSKEADGKAIVLAQAAKSAKAGQKEKGSGQDAPPSITATTPAVGATDVDPAIAEITVTFDRDMAGGFSWTGGGPYYPTIPEGSKPQWREKRTCVLPVKLEPGRFYRVGINSTSHQNFRSADGIPSAPSAIYFVTRGASDEVKALAKAPAIVTMEPANGATGVNPKITELRVTFDIPMGGGNSWCGGGPNFPAIPEGKRASWSADRKTAILPVELKPNWKYQLWLNSVSFKNFASEGGVALEPVGYSFSTGQ